jgi:hypothetical protein
MDQSATDFLRGVASFESQASPDEGAETAAAEVTAAKQDRKEQELRREEDRSLTHTLKIHTEQKDEMDRLWGLVQRVFPGCSRSRFDWTLSAMATNAVGV